MVHKPTIKDEETNNGPQIKIKDDETNNGPQTKD